MARVIEHADRYRWLRPTAVILSAAAAIVVGVSRITIVEQPVKYHTKYVAVPRGPVTKPTGYINEDQCRALAASPPSLNDLIARYGFPAQDSSHDTIILVYFFGKDSNRSCTLDFWNGPDKATTISEELRG